MKKHSASSPSRKTSASLSSHALRHLMFRPMSRCVVFILLFAAANWAGASQGPVIRDDEAIRKMLSTRVDLQKQATGIVVGVGVGVVALANAQTAVGADDI